MWDGGYYREDKYRFPPVKWGPDKDDNGDKGTFPSMCRGLYYVGGLKVGIIIREIWNNMFPPPLHKGIPFR